jgi:hypothetical protein
MRPPPAPLVALQLFEHVPLGKARDGRGTQRQISLTLRPMARRASIPKGLSSSDSRTR